MDAVKFAVNDEVMFTDAQGNLSLGVIEAIEGDAHTIRVLAQTADGTTVPTDIVLTLTAADLMPMDGAEQAEEDLDLSELDGDGSEESEDEIELDLSELEDDEEDLEEKALSELFEEDLETDKAVEDVDLTPTEEMAMEAAQGLEWRQEFNRGGTEVGVARARDISNRTQLSPETVFRMTSFFARHEVDKQAEGFNEGEEGYPSAGRIAWALWGGDPGRDWADRKAREIEGEQEAEKSAMPVFKMGDFVTYESDAGPVTAKITDILTEGAAELEGMEPVKASPDAPVYLLDIYEPATEGMAYNGIQTAMCGDKLKLCDEPMMGTMKHLPRFVGKLKKAEVSENVEEGKGYVKGYLSIFDNVDLGGDVVKMGAFKRTLDHKGGKVVFMLDHGYKTGEVLGILELEEDQRGLLMTGVMNLKTIQGRNTFETIRFQAEQGVPIGASIGYEIKQSVPNKTGGYDLTEVELWEGSVTPFPMNQEALITEAYKRYNRDARAKRARLYRAVKQ